MLFNIELVRVVILLYELEAVKLTNILYDLDSLLFYWNKISLYSYISSITDLIR